MLPGLLQRRHWTCRSIIHVCRVFLLTNGMRFGTWQNTFTKIQQFCRHPFTSNFGPRQQPEETPSLCSRPCFPNMGEPTRMSQAPLRHACPAQPNWYRMRRWMRPYIVLYRW